MNGNWNYADSNRYIWSTETKNVDVQISITEYMSKMELKTKAKTSR